MALTTIVVDQSTLQVTPGIETSLQATVRNQSQSVAQYTFAAEGVGPTWVIFEPPQVGAFPEDKAEVRVRVRAPAGTVPATYRLVMRAKDQTGQAGEATAEITLVLAGGQSTAAPAPAAVSAAPEAPPKAAEVRAVSAGGAQLELVADQGGVVLAAGGRGQLHISAINRAASPLEIELNVRGLPGTWLALTPSTASLPPSGRADFVLALMPPGNAPTGSYPIDLIGRSPSEPAITARLDLGLEVVESGQLSVDVTPSQADGPVSALYQVRVSLIGGVPARVQLSASDPGSACEYTFDPATLTVTEDKPVVARLTVRARQPLSSGARTVPFAVSAAALESSAPPAYAAGRFVQRALTALTVALDPPEQRASNLARYVVNVQNNGDAPATVRLTASDPQNACRYQFSLTTFTVTPGGIGQAGLTVTPSQPMSGPDERTVGFTVRAIPSTEGAAPGQAEARLVLEAAPLPLLVISPSGQSAARRAQYTLTVSNPRATALELQLRPSETGGACSLAITPAVLQVPAGGQAAARVTVQPSTELLPGESRRVCNFGVLAFAPDLAVPASASGSLVQVPGSPIWPLLLVIPAGLLVALIAALIVLFRPFSPPQVADITPTTGPTATMGPDLAATAQVLALAQAATQTAIAGNATLAVYATATAAANATGTAVAGGTATAIANAANAQRATATALKATVDAQGAAAKATADAAALATASAKMTADARDTTPPALTLGHTPANPTRIDRVTITATGTDAKGIKKIQITLNGGVAKECSASPCVFEGGPFPDLASLVYSAAAWDAAGNQTTAPNKTVTLASALLYDFVQQANSASWTSGAGALPFGGSDVDPKGFALWRTNPVLDSGPFAGRALETHPQWVNNGYIKGAYANIATPAYVVAASDVFRARMGLLQGGTAGKVKFRVLIQPQGSGEAVLGEVADTYDGSLKTLQVSLAAWAGKRATFTLEVQANPTSSQAWATWVEAKLYRGAP
jgi:hypothetical protein